MSLQPDPSDLHLRARDDLASLALGEPVDPALAEHVAGCELCQDELAALGRVVDLARGGAVADTAAPPPSVWDRIAAEVAADRDRASGATRPAAAPATPVADVVPLAPRRRPRGRWALAAAAAVVAIGGAGTVGWAVGRSSGPTPVRQAYVAPLAAQPGTQDDVHGVARVHPTPAGGLQIDVRTYRLPAHDGYYEVWLYDPDVNKMIAVGALGTGGRGVFTVPAGLDLRDYRVVDVSAQRYNGNPAHDRSVLRGPLST